MLPIFHFKIIIHQCTRSSIDINNFEPILTNAVPSIVSKNEHASESRVQVKAIKDLLLKDSLNSK